MRFVLLLLCFGMDARVGVHALPVYYTCCGTDWVCFCALNGAYRSVLQFLQFVTETQEWLPMLALFCSSPWKMAMPSPANDWDTNKQLRWLPPLLCGLTWTLFKLLVWQPEGLIHKLEDCPPGAQTLMRTGWVPMTNWRIGVSTKKRAWSNWPETLRNYLKWHPQVFLQRPEEWKLHLIFQQSTEQLSQVDTSDLTDQSIERI